MTMLKGVMQDVCWSFTGERFDDRATFGAELQEYQKDIRSLDAWDPGQLVIHAPAIRVQYVYWDDDDEIDGLITLEAGDKTAFSAGELLFLLHNAVVDQLNDVDHHFFEGLWPAAGQDAGLAPLYHLRQGS